MSLENDFLTGLNKETNNRETFQRNRTPTSQGNSKNKDYRERYNRSKSPADYIDSFQSRKLTNNNNNSNPNNNYRDILQTSKSPSTKQPKQGQSSQSRNRGALNIISNNKTFLNLMNKPKNSLMSSNIFNN